jgi:hypothetical protein
MENLGRERNTNCISLEKTTLEFCYKGKMEVGSIGDRNRYQKKVGWFALRDIKSIVVSS